MKKVNKKDLIIYGITFLLTCIIFLPLLLGHYASDSYNIYNIGYHDYAIQYSLNDGRVFMSILGLIASKLHIPLETYIFITLLLAIVISNIAVLVLSKIIKRYKEPRNIFQEIIVIIISYITIFNFMYLENMYFVECIVMSISTLLFIISANVLVEKNKKYFIKSLTLTILGVMFYQGTVGMFFTFVFLFTILKNKNNVKQIIIDLVQIGIIAGIAVVIDLLIIKITGNILNMEQTRVEDFSQIPGNIMYIIRSIPKLIKYSAKLFPENLLLIFLNIITAIVIVYQIMNMKKDNVIYKYLAIIVITIASSSVVSIITLTSFSAGRTNNCLGSLVGVIFTFLYVYTNLLENKGILSKVAILTLLAFSIINICNYESTILTHKKINKLEKEETKELNEYLLQYENSTGIYVNKVTKIQVYNNTEKAYFNGIKNKSVFAHNSMRLYWSADGFVNFYTKRNMQTVGVTETQRNYYLQNHDEQRGYECIGDTLYITTYMI